MSQPLSTDDQTYPRPTATVHWCDADGSHPMHVTIGVRKPGWVFTLSGCIGNVKWFKTEAEAREFAASFVGTREQPVKQSPPSATKSSESERST